MMAMANKIFERYPWLDRLRNWAQTVTMPGFDEVAMWEVFAFLIAEIRKGAVGMHARSVAFTFFLAVFPTVIFIFTLIPYIPVNHLQENLVGVIHELIPNGAADLLQQAIAEAAGKTRGGLLSMGVFTALYIATNGMIGMMESFDRDTEHFTHRGMFKTRLVAIQLTFLLFILLIFSLGLIVAGNKFLIYLLREFNILSSFSVILFTTLKYLMIFTLFFNSISVIYRYGPARMKKWKFISPGSMLATILSILVSMGFSFFVNKFGGPSRLFGSLGTIMALQIWIYLNSFARLIGFELNTSIEHQKQLRKSQKAAAKVVA
jgi:membrane protein